jgi:hypothetical protein
MGADVDRELSRPEKRAQAVNLRLMDDVRFHHRVEPIGKLHQSIGGQRVIRHAAAPLGEGNMATATKNLKKWHRKPASEARKFVAAASAQR